MEDALRRALRESGAEMIILAGFMSILSEAFTAEWPERILNVHPSLIPAFCGKGFYGLHVHEAALTRGVKVTARRYTMSMKFRTAAGFCCRRRWRCCRTTRRRRCSGA